MATVDNCLAGKVFSGNVRRLLLRKHLKKFDEKEYQNMQHWFKLNDMLEIADDFNIFGAFNNTGNHWRLVLKVLNPHELLVYDPLFGQGPRQDHIYTLQVQDLRNSVTFPSRAVIKADNWAPSDYGSVSGQNTPKDAQSELNRLNKLMHDHYHLHLPQNFLQEHIQQDSWNCGPLAVYAALMGDEHTRKYLGKVNLENLKKEAGIVVVKNTLVVPDVGDCCRP